MRYFFVFVLLLAATKGEAQRGGPGGSGSRLREQNRIAESYNLSKMTSARQILRMAKIDSFVRIPSKGRGFYIDPRLGRRFSVPHALLFARKWVRDYILAEADSFAAAFPKSKFKITSLVRTTGYQNSLMRRNRVAARCKTPLTCSPHLTGSTLDISKKGLSKLQRQWFRDRHISQQKCGQVSVIPEKAAFHIFVHPEFGKTPCNSASLE